MKKIEMINASTGSGLQAYVNIFLENHPDAHIIDIKYQMTAIGSNYYGVHYSVMIIYEE